MGKKKDPDLELTNSDVIRLVKETGFDLEHRISEILEKHLWTVINGRYYVDDQQEKVREIDIIAYKTGKDGELSIYTTLIISCKKSTANLWTLLTKAANEKDPNANWRPLCLWSNAKAFNFMRDQAGWENSYYEKLEGHKVTNLFSIPAVHTFAFQEINKKQKKVANDEAIFNSITSLMKAQSYEIASLPKRKKTSCIYQFNLLSVVEAEMKRVLYLKGGPVVSDLHQTHHVASYIINKQPISARIHFVHSNMFEGVLEEYNKLHTANCSLFARDYKDFYVGVIKDFNRRQVFREEIKTDIFSRLQWIIPKEDRDKVKRSLCLTWNSEEDRLEIQVDTTPETIESLNNAKNIRELVSQLLSKYYKYEGSFLFTIDEIPF